MYISSMYKDKISINYTHIMDINFVGYYINCPSLNSSDIRHSLTR